MNIFSGINHNVDFITIHVHLMSVFILVADETKTMSIREISRAKSQKDL